MMTPNMKIYEHLDLSKKRKVWAVGDIHGCFRMLDAKLDEIGFDKTNDMLISVGDLVDRGPQSHEAIYYAKEPWFKHILGNHETMCRDNAGDFIHTYNGGGWMNRFSPEEKREHINILCDAPVVLDVLTPKGLHVGFVHADLCFMDWEDNWKTPHVPTLLWSRTGFSRLRDPDYEPFVRGIDKVFHGHNALYKPVKRGNINWIDTGCGFEDGYMTIVNVDEF